MAELMPAWQLRVAGPSDWAAVEALLREHGLPLDGAREHLQDYWIVEDDDGDVVGCGGFEHYGDEALLRSVVIAGRLRGRALGTTLARRLFEQAEARGVRTLYLLTTTAPAFFARLGFAPCDRSMVPAAILASAEFTGACPASAILMSRAVSGGASA